MAQAALTVRTFGRPGGAAEAASTLAEASARELITVHDGAVVTWEPGERRPRATRAAGLAGSDAPGDAFWGLFFGLVFFVPLLGAALGTAPRAIAGTLTDVGIDDSFIHQVRDQVAPGTSALFVLSSGATGEAVRDALDRHAPEELVVADLTDEQESVLRAVFAD
ncbi:DUF1269 domain-containing protein [Brachybacterium sp. YJGR34]|uniref:DUF1269 domain-containing protein n=1 Tax=Brachybacterium sp. YJGR34 TaxID=2059911 RepID=UPI000E0A4885|nr:DUF1269 domain-containing protein [Brachybacterium sp. YJGR34]